MSVKGGGVVALPSSDTELTFRFGFSHVTRPTLIAAEPLRFSLRFLSSQDKRSVRRAARAVRSNEAMGKGTQPGQLRPRPCAAFRRADPVAVDTADDVRYGVAVAPGRSRRGGPGGAGRSPR